MSDITGKFSERLAEAMFEKKMTAALLAKQLGLNVYDIYHWLKGTGKFMPAVSVLVKLADYFECSVGFLIGLEEVNSLLKPKPAEKRQPFSQRFPKIVREKGTNFFKLKEAANISNTTVFYNWVNGKSEPRIDSLIAVSRALNCSVDYLLDRED